MDLLTDAAHKAHGPHLARDCTLIGMSQKFKSLCDSSSENHKQNYIQKIAGVLFLVENHILPPLYERLTTIHTYGYITFDE